MKVLEQVRVLDLSPYLPSQYCSYLLAQLGAEVILVERPGPRAEPFPGLFELLNYGKKSLQLDLKSEFGREAFGRLAKTTEVIIEGFRPGVASRLGIGYEDIKKLRADIIYCAVSGFGQDGPYRDKPGHDVNYLALSGYFSIPGQIGVPPSRPGIPVVDLSAGTFAAFSIMTALMYREKSHQGQYLDISMLDVITNWTSMRGGEYLVHKTPVTDEHVGATNGVFQTSNGKLVAMGIMEEHFWQAFCQTAGCEALARDSRFATYEARLRNKKELWELLKDIMSRKAREEWLELFKKSDVPVTPVLTLEEALIDLQIVHRGLVREIADPTLGTIGVVGLPVKFSDISTELKTPPPRAGQHTREILSELGYADEIVSSLEAG